MTDVVDGELCEQCMCSHCDEYVSVHLGNTCAGCSRDCVLRLPGHEPRWRDADVRRLVHTLSDSERLNLSQRVAAAESPRQPIDPAHLETAAAGVVRLVKGARQMAVARYGAGPVNAFQGGAAIATAFGLMYAGSRRRKKR
jgi:hypothetical protein